MGIRGELFTTKVILENRTYFFNVKENRLGDLYLNIVESKNKDAGGFDRQSVVLFADDLQDFLKGFDESLRVMEKAYHEQKRKPRGTRETSHERHERDGIDNKSEEHGSDDRKSYPSKPHHQGGGKSAGAPRFEKKGAGKRGAFKSGKKAEWNKSPKFGGDDFHRDTKVDAENRGRQKPYDRGAGSTNAERKGPRRVVAVRKTKHPDGE